MKRKTDLAWPILAFVVSVTHFTIYYYTDRIHFFVTGMVFQATMFMMFHDNANKE